MRKIIIILCVCLFSFTGFAQKTSYEYIAEYPERCANWIHRYEALDLTDTPSPEGFKPFYISHIGRHGSRYQRNSDIFDVPISRLQEYKDKKLLTKDGEKLLKGIIAIKEASEGHYGKLTAIGREEHIGISERMVKRFPEVFNNPERKKIIACSTTSGRVVESRDIFLATLETNTKALEINLYAGKEIYDGASAKERVSGRTVTKEEKQLADSLGKKKVSPEKNTRAVSWDSALERIYKMDKIDDKRAARKALEKAYQAIITAQCLPEKGLPEILDFFTVEEVYTQWYASNFLTFKKMCICSENQGVLAFPRSCPILEHWVEDADKAIAGNGVAANLRFSHDTFCQPFFSLVGAAGNDYMGSAIQANEHYLAFLNVCMACNMQFIFYQNSDGQVLVKLLQNEREVTIPSLDTVGGVYHDWNVLRPYLIERYSFDKK